MDDRCVCSFVGVKCTVLEKSKSFSKHPQAHFINNRSMEVDFIAVEDTIFG